MKKSLLVIVMSLFVVFIVACSTETTSEATEEERDENSESITIEHALGTTIVDKNPSKVVVFDMGVLDILDTFNVDVASVPKANIPRYLSHYQDDRIINAGTLFEPDFETIYDIQPDLIIISTRAVDAYGELSEIAPTLFLELDTKNYMESFRSNVETLAEIFDKEELAAEELDTIEQAVTALNEKATANEISGLIVLENEGAISAYGPGSRFGVLHAEFGIAPVDEGIDVSTHGQNISFEYITEKDPEYLFVVDRGAVVTGGNATSKQTFDNDLVARTQAHQNGNIIYLDPEYWYISSGGLTSVAGMVSEVLAAIE